MAKFRIRELLYRYPWLFEASTKVLAAGCSWGVRFLTDAMANTRVMHPQAKEVLDGDGAYLVTMWHGAMAGVMHLKPRHRFTCLVSNSRDGEMIARGMIGMGFLVARGSSKRGGTRGVMELMRAVKAGQRPTFMVDGPKGPLYEVKPGVIWTAKATGVPIVPLGYKARDRWDMNSWDRYDASSWGSPVVSIFGEPMYIPRNCTEDDLERYRLILQEKMIYLQKMADEYWEKQS